MLSLISCTVLLFFVDMRCGRVIEGLKYHVADVANITSVNEIVVSSKVVMGRPWRNLWISVTKNQKA